MSSVPLVAMSAIFLIAICVCSGVFGRVLFISSLLEIKDEFAVFAALFEQRVARLLGKGGHVAHRARIGRDDAQYLARGHVGQRLLGLYDGQWAGHARCVKFLVEFHILSPLVG